MVSNKTLLFISNQLSLITGKETWFGGMNMLLLGDLFQVIPFRLPSQVNACPTSSCNR